MRLEALQEEKHARTIRVLPFRGRDHDDHGQRCAGGFCISRSSQSYFEGGTAQNIQDEHTGNKVMVVDKDGTGYIETAWDADICADEFLIDTERYFSHFERELSLDTSGEVRLVHRSGEVVAASFERPLQENEVVREALDVLGDDMQQLDRIEITTPVGSIAYGVGGAVFLGLTGDRRMREEKIAAAVDLIHATNTEIPDHILYQALK